MPMPNRLAAMLMLLGATCLGESVEVRFDTHRPGLYSDELVREDWRDVE